MPINTSMPLGRVGHIIPDDARTYCPEEWLYIDLDQLWPKLFNQRCDFEVFCRWHKLHIPKACSANMLEDVDQDSDQMATQMIRENN